MPSANEQIADHLANRRVRPLTEFPPASQARSAYAAYASTPTGRVMDVSRRSDGQIPGSGETSPNPVFCAMPTQPENTSTVAGAARTSSGQDPHSPGAGEDRGGPVPSGWSGGPGSGRTAWSTRYGAGAVHARGKRGHGGHHRSCVARGWGSPVSAARAAATSWVVART